MPRGGLYDLDELIAAHGWEEVCAKANMGKITLYGWFDGVDMGGPRAPLGIPLDPAAFDTAFAHPDGNRLLLAVDVYEGGKGKVRMLPRSAHCVVAYEHEVNSAWPTDEPSRTATGFAGRPTSRERIDTEFRRRLAAGECANSRAKEAECLAAWWRKNKRDGEPAAAVGTIKNNLPADFQPAARSRMK